LTKILIASHNQNKVTEIKDLVKDLDIELISLSDLGDLDEVIEDGSTFFENAYKKAFYFAKKYQMSTLSDDSGLCVMALDEKPGVLSARYTTGGDIENNKKVLTEMVNNKNREAYFICSIVFVNQNFETKSFEGRVYGEIYHEMSGQNGFGYDSIFYYPKLNKTFGNLSKEEKNKISHRANALSQFKDYLYEITHHK
jgi:XTP/dITP diphosphohydrolase